ncbi:MAG: hypothetical protein ABSE49_02100 [Polyangiaceae bacterium]|jgi:hypothetical protein
MATQSKKTKATSTATPTPAASALPAASPTPAATPPPTPPPPTAATAQPPVTQVANGNNKGSKVDLQTAYLSLIAGLLAFFQPGDTFALAAGIMTRDQLIALFQQFVAAAQATKNSNAAWRTDVQAERAMELTVAPIRTGLKSILQGKFGKSGTQLLQFGIAPLKVVPKTTEVMTAAVAKSKATRAARGTKGSVQKKQITGNVTGVIITPVTAGPATPVATGNAASANGGTAAPPAAPAPAGTPTPAAAPANGTTPHS